ncbi:MAG: hypothetical protein JST02_00430 [Bacteroidetes bacterium]|nr:hypothetical protein [Bacteroidota bacterium]
MIVVFLSTQCMDGMNNILHGNISQSKNCCKTKKSCCKESSQKKQRTPIKDDCRNGCNPFMACCGWLFIGVQKINIHCLILPYETVKNGTWNDWPTSSYISSPWHPPRVVI